jgi:anaerobic ribonucleoside-triphosphate reductase activating protein
MRRMNGDARQRAPAEQQLFGQGYRLRIGRNRKACGRFEYPAAKRGHRQNGVAIHATNQDELGKLFFMCYRIYGNYKLSRKVKILINKVHFPITTLGFGSRVGIWMQGCSIRCPGCVSRDTWRSAVEHSTTVEDVLSACAPWLRQADGVTISGGEPFDQPEALCELVGQLRAASRGDLLVYSGYPHARLFAEHTEILRQIDVLISEPFLAEKGQTLTLRGSDNQRAFLLSDLAHRRYPADLDRQDWPAQRRLDLMLEEETVWMVGIPAPGDMERFKVRLQSHGYSCSTSAESEPRIRA